VETLRQVPSQASFGVTKCRAVGVATVKQHRHGSRATTAFGTVYTPQNQFECRIATPNPERLTEQGDRHELPARLATSGSAGTSISSKCSSASKRFDEFVRNRVSNALLSAGKYTRCSLPKKKPAKRAMAHSLCTSSTSPVASIDGTC